MTLSGTSHSDDLRAAKVAAIVVVPWRPFSFKGAPATATACRCNRYTYCDERVLRCRRQQIPPQIQTRRRRRRPFLEWPFWFCFCSPIKYLMFLSRLAFPSTHKPATSVSRWLQAFLQWPLRGGPMKLFTVLEVSVLRWGGVYLGSGAAKSS